MILGITGCPGSGKSLVAAAVAAHGWELVDADEMGRRVVEDDPAMLGRLSARFGDDIVGGGTLDRRLLGARAFADAGATRDLNGIVHPVLVDRLNTVIADRRTRGVDTIVDCALIFEWNSEGLFDYIVCVAAGEEMRRRRLIERDGRAPRDIERLCAAQLPQEEKMRRADIVIHNNGSRDRMDVFGRMLACLAPDSGGCV